MVLPGSDVYFSRTMAYDKDQAHCVPSSSYSPPFRFVNMDGRKEPREGPVGSLKFTYITGSIRSQFFDLASAHLKI